MEPTDYEQKKREFKKKMLAELFKTKKALVNYENDIFNYTFDRAYALGKQEKEMKEPGCGQTIKGWAACDRDGMLRLHYDKPERTDGGYWQGGFKSSYLPTAVVLPIVWESDPIEVDVIIKPHLTSDAEGEEMLMVSAITVREMYAANERIKTDAPDKELGRTSDHINHVLRCLFGSKCLPDEAPLSQNPSENCDTENHISTDCDKPAKPKFKVGDKVRIVSLHGRPTPHKGDVDVVAHINTGNDEQRYYLENHYHCAFGFSESDLEPYTETTFTDTITNDCKSRNISQETANCDKQFDNIPKDGFAKERRLNIAAMMMQGILSNTDRMKQYGEIAMRESETLTQLVARNAMRYADALIAECESKH